MMDDTFDPYQKWLGISAKHQPPHHYRLLAIELFEGDLDTIESAADQRMAHLRSMGAGKRAEIAQRLHNEMATAKICLLNAERKQEYDRELKQKLDAGHPKMKTVRANPLSEPAHRGRQDVGVPI